MGKTIKPLDRLFGLETELAIRHNQDSHWGGQGLNAEQIYQEVCIEINKRTSIAPPQGEKSGIFLANGSVVWFERLLPWLKRGLLEVCTPECKDPRELVASHAAMDQIVADALHSCPPDTALLKNCVDPNGISYGCQENFEVEGFDDSEAKSWHRGMQLLKVLALGTMAMMAMVWILIPLLLKLPVLMLSAGAVFYAAACYGQRRWANFSDLFYYLVVFLLVPQAIAVSIFCRKQKIGRTYETLKPFLFSRIVVNGSGGIDNKGNFYLSQRAETRNTDWLVAFCSFQKAVFCFNHQFKNLCKPNGSKALSSQRQRLSIAIGDSNMSQEATWLKVATTCLVIDAIEAGFIREVPRLKQPLKALKKINQSPELKATVDTSRGEMTAIEIQQFYLNACRQYVESFEDPPQQALDVLRTWSDVLMRLSTDIESLFGRVDWITKRQVMRQLLESQRSKPATENINTAKEFANFNDLAALKKADLKYHELGSEGYYQQLVDAGVCSNLIPSADCERAGRMPPTAVSAAQRCRYIREFGEQIEWITWDQVKLHGKAPVEFEQV